MQVSLSAGWFGGFVFPRGSPQFPFGPVNVSLTAAFSRGVMAQPCTAQIPWNPLHGCSDSSEPPKQKGAQAVLSPQQALAGVWGLCFYPGFWEGTKCPCHGTWRVWPWLFALEHNTAYSSSGWLWHQASALSLCLDGVLGAVHRGFGTGEVQSWGTMAGTAFLSWPEHRARTCGAREEFPRGFYWIIPEKKSLTLKLIPWKTQRHTLLRENKLPVPSWCVWSLGFIIWLFCSSGCVLWLRLWWHCGPRCAHTGGWEL